jgi:hypothetical protein
MRGDEHIIIDWDWGKYNFYFLFFLTKQHFLIATATTAVTTAAVTCIICTILEICILPVNRILFFSTYSYFTRPAVVFVLVLVLVFAIAHPHHHSHTHIVIVIVTV